MDPSADNASSKPSEDGGDIGRLVQTMRTACGCRNTLIRLSSSRLTRFDAQAVWGLQNEPACPAGTWKKGIAYELIELDLRGNQHRQPDFLAINPLANCQRWWMTAMVPIAEH